MDQWMGWDDDSLPLQADPKDKKEERRRPGQEEEGGRLIPSSQSILEREEGKGMAD